MSDPYLFDHQRAAFRTLANRAQTYFTGHWRNLPIKTRWHSLVVGPTGTGKTALARMVADATGAALFQISAPSWMPSGAHDRAAAQTLPLLLKHVAYHERTVLFVDEVDKIHEPNSPWLNFIRGELLETYDGRWNTGLKPDDDEIMERELLSGSKLQTATFVISAGTFQQYYDSGPPAVVGFHQSPNLSDLSPTADLIAQRLPREIVNRHHSRLVLLPELSLIHYRELAKQAEMSLPGWLAPGFRKASNARLSQAVASKLGCRYVEESLADALMASQPTIDPPLICPERT